MGGGRRRHGVIGPGLLLLAMLLPSGGVVQAQSPDGGDALRRAIAALRDQTADIQQRDVGYEGFSQRGQRAAVWADELTAELDSLRERRKRINDRVATSGMTAAIRVVLRRDRTALPDIQEDEREISRRDDEISEVDLQLIEIEKEHEALGHLDEAVARVLDGLTPPSVEGEYPELDVQVREALQEQVRVLDDLIEAGTDCFGSLIRLNRLHSTVISEAEDFRTYIDGSTMWIRDALPITPAGLRARPGSGQPGILASGGSALLWLVDPGEWAETGFVLWGDVRTNPVPAVLFLVAVLLLVRLRPRLKRPLDDLADKVGRTSSDAFRHTLHALGLTVLLACIWPSVLLLFAWRLSLPDTNTDFSSAVAAGLRSTAALAIALNLLKEICRPKGLGEAHFRWPTAVAAAVRKHVRLLSLTALPAVFLVAMFHAYGNSDWSEALGRAGFLVGYLTLAVVSWHMLRTSGRIVKTLLDRERDRWVMWLNLIWRPLLLVLPLTLVVMAGTGYYGTALTLQLRFQLTIWLAVCLLVLNALLLRWLYVARRRLAIQKARERRAAAALAAQQGKENEEPPPPTEKDIDIGSLDLQTRRILGSFQVLVLLIGTWFIWQDALPALGILNRVQLWSHTGQVAEPKLDESGMALYDEFEEPIFDLVDRVLPVTLADLFLAIVLLLMTSTAARNVPGLIEITMLRRLPLEPSGRYAIKTLTRYVISIVGIVLVFGAIGIGWGEVQWLAAAITVGLGFGLQEIFANFVSGIILLIERPIRVGDTVTVGGVDGTIAKIRMRATTIVDWDRKELVVPNKEFITSQLVNWTLADTTLRVIVSVGIAYGSDTRLATKLLYQVAEECPEVLAKPKPRVIFKEFGDSTLNFELRAFVNSPELVRHLPHDLNLAIDDAFREHKIEIAFPQRDLHIRTSEPVLRHMRESDPA
jgi:potassium efflux system protein